MSESTSVIYVAYGVEHLDFAWIPDGVPVVVVHNDGRLPPQAPLRPGVVDLGDGRNLGFGAGVNLALASVSTPRVVLCNPDTLLEPAHFTALTTADDDEVVTVPLADRDGLVNSVVNAYWNPLAFVATARRLGRFAPRDGAVRRFVAPLLGRWGRGHAESLAPTAGSWWLSERWASGAVLSLPTAAVRAVGGFDERYFLYYEDTDLQQRMAAADPTLRLRLADVAPAIHDVGGSTEPGEREQLDTVARIRRLSARAYAQAQSGVGWRVAAALVGGPTAGGEAAT